MISEGRVWVRGGGGGVQFNQITVLSLRIRTGRKAKQCRPRLDTEERGD